MAWQNDLRIALFDRVLDALQLIHLFGGLLGRLKPKSGARASFRADAAFGQKPAML